ncbi:hypothetical protein ABZ672_04265 [Streptomyces mirabilis]|uniref:hypothetical protein n=1 Tax=Streptomyces mirabilis TaxID=68239 RepID=UPI0034056130
MGSLFEELEAREAAARVRVEEFEAELAAVSAKLELAREGLERLRIARLAARAASWCGSACGTSRRVGIRRRPACQCGQP